MRITSKHFNHGSHIPLKYSCTGENINPSLSFSDIPADAQSLVLIVDDPDVPVAVREDRMFDHWTVFNIPPETTMIDEGSSPTRSLEGVNGRGEIKYQGPCPPDTIHRYFFKLYALDTMLSLESGSTKAEVEQVMQNHVLDKAELVGLFEQEDSLKTIK